MFIARYKEQKQKGEKIIYRGKIEGLVVLFYHRIAQRFSYKIKILRFLPYKMLLFYQHVAQCLFNPGENAGFMGKYSQLLMWL
jgi:hypothetical protein